MKRKIIQIADSTQLISLPRKWAVKHDLKKGDELEVNEEGTKLVIQTDKHVEGGAKDINVTKLDRDSLMYLIRALYKNSYDEIILRYDQSYCENIRTKKREKIRDVISKEVSRLNGFEIFTQKEDYCIIKSISEDSIKGFENMLRRIFLLTVETLDDFNEGYRLGDRSTLETIQQKHDTITKFIAYSQRLLLKVGYTNYKKTEFMYHLLETIDVILDLVKYNARFILEQSMKASKEGIAIAIGVTDSFKIYYDFYYKYNLEKMYKLNKNRYDILSQIKEYQKKMSKQELSILSNVSQILEHILNLTNARIALEY